MRDLDEFASLLDAADAGPDHGIAPQARGCEWPGCDEAGDYRAPRSPTELRTFRWFCLEHVRAYNGAWDFFAGMSADEIERIRRADVIGHRPTWPLGLRAANGFRFADARIRDFFGTYTTEGADGRSGTFGGRREATDDPRREATAMMDLKLDATVHEIKARYKVLVKIHHPDANGGDKASEERLKSINQAYTFLMANADS